jgi:ATP-dependent DNA helicase RecQ
MDHRQLRTKLQQHFGFHQFRPGQARAVESALAGQDTIVIMPTGSGKSLCFQLPALELEGITIVVSPLISLMKDQVDQLRVKGIAAELINSSLSADERRAAEESVSKGSTHFVYTTPEQIATPEFRRLLKRQLIDLFVVDEAHCISQWGHGFRPEFLALGEAISDLGKPPVLALTATASEDTLSDIRAFLRIPNAEVIHTGFYRRNLRLEVLNGQSAAVKRAAIEQVISTLGMGIVYTSTVKSAEEVFESLGGSRHGIGLYHGKLAARQRAAMQDAFMGGRLKAMIATNAFGLGIDKPDVRFVVHYEAPGSLEPYYQEIGRAGRDGNAATCTLLFDPEDLKIQKFLSARRFPDESELVNVYYTISRLCDAGQALTPSSIAQASPVRGARLRVCLDLFATQRILMNKSSRRLQLMQPGLNREQIARLGQSFRERQEQAKIKQQQVLEFATNGRCRWQSLLATFDSDEVPLGCGHCDVCAAQPLAKAS